MAIEDTVPDDHLFGACTSRNFYELATPGPAPIASEALEHIAALYAVENDIHGRSVDETSRCPTAENPAAGQCP